MALAHLEAALRQPPLSFLEPPFHLVGGCVRDALLGRALADWDVVVARDAPGAARRLADRIGGSFVPLDEERAIARVVGPDRVVVDICEYAGGGLEEDLRRRDFTINSLAFDGTTLTDPLGGRQDLERRCLRCCSERSLGDDPLRVLRAFRFVGELGFELAPGLEAQLQRECPGLEGVARERIRDEFFRLLRVGLTRAPGLEESLVRSGVLQEVVPAWSAVGLAVLTELDGLSPEPWLQEHLEAPLGGERRRLEVLKLAALHWHCRGRDHEAQRLKADHCLARSEMDYLARVLRPEPAGPQSAEERYHLYRRLADCLPDFAVLVGCARPELQAEASLWLREYHQRSSLAFPPRFLSGADLHQLGVPAGREMGRLLGALEHAGALGQIASREEALSLAERLWRER